VRAAAAADLLPWAGSTREHVIDVEGAARVKGDEVRGSLRRTSPEYFGALRIPVRHGRAFTAADDSAAARVAIVSQAFARKAWPGAEALGRRVRFAQVDGRSEWRAVVGVAADVRRNWFERDLAPTVYVPVAQWAPVAFQLAVRTAGDPAAMTAAARRALAALDPQQPAHDVMPLEHALANQISGVRMGATVMSMMGVFALLLTALGLYGLVAFAVALRTREMGLRMALGARREDVLALVLGEGSRLALTGVAIGAPVAIALAVVMAATLFGVVKPQWWELAGVALALAIVSALASGLPAWRASRLDPVDALRQE